MHAAISRIWGIHPLPSRRLQMAQNIAHLFNSALLSLHRY